MRRSLIGMVVAAATALVPLLALAGNQEVAEQVAKTLRSSGQLHDYKIGVKYQDGTAWLKGQVTSEEQARAALAVASQVPGVTRVKNELSVAAAQPAAMEPTAGSRIQFGRENFQAGRLQAASGAFAPEQISRVSSSGAAGGWVAGTLDASSMQRLQDAQQTALAQPVPTSFTQVPASPVMATEGPTVANRAPVQAPTQAQAPVQARTQAQAPVQAPTQAQVPVQAPAQSNSARSLRPVAVARTQPPVVAQQAETASPPSYPMMAMAGAPIGVPIAMAAAAMPCRGGAPCASGVAPARHDQPNMPGYAWPSYASYPNYAAVTYPRQYSPTAWPYIGPFYPYPQVPLGWRKVTLEWDDGWWMLDFKDK